jgi:hypothetical protein
MYRDVTGAYIHNKLPNLQSNTVALLSVRVHNMIVDLQKPEYIVPVGFWLVGLVGCLAGIPPLLPVLVAKLSVSQAAFYTNIKSQGMRSIAINSDSTNGLGSG